MTLALLPALVSCLMHSYPVQASGHAQEESLYMQMNDSTHSLSPDSTPSFHHENVRTLTEVTIHSDIRYHETILPQQIKGEALQRLNAHSVADALRHLSGLQLKDYGGLGGIKTINIRSMGSQHVGIYYDGIELGNAQNGQIDLGQFSLDNVSEISVYYGQRSAIQQTASDFANAGSIYIRTQVPTCNALRIKLQGGSSNMGRASLLWHRRLNERLSLSANVEGLSSDGHYPFRYRRLNYDGTVAYDTTATRQNGDIQAIRTEVNLYGRSSKSDQTHWDLKAYTYHSTRGIPGAIVNNVWRRGERQGDSNTFVQGALQHDFSERYTARLAAKYAHYATHYQNRDTTQLTTDQRYRQQELYLTTTHVLTLSDWWSTSASYDVRWNQLRSDAPHFANPTRLSQLASMATAFDTRFLQLQASLVFTHIDDHVCIGQAQAAVNRLTPALFLSITPMTDRKALQIRGFAKKSFRMPTFNDLYYTNMGNALLKPETAIQYSIGMRSEWYAKSRNPSPSYMKPPHVTFTWSVDLYHNTVHDKIVAYPKGQQFRWTMLNLGRVHIDGLDLQGDFMLAPIREFSSGLRLQYTCQQSRDVTDPSTSYYRDQIPYVPKHSGSATLWSQWRGLSFSYNFIYTGTRYCQQENILYNRLQPWYTSDLSLSYEKKKTRITLGINNLLDQQYDVIINYPMPGRNYMLAIMWNL